MNINLTLIGQSIAFGAFVWFCMKYVWPPLIAVLDERKQRIAEGLAAAERGVEEQEAAEQRAAELIKEAKMQAADILSNAKRQGNELVNKAKGDAGTERDRILANGEAEVEQQMTQARGQLHGQLSSLVVEGTGKLLGREVDAKVHKDLLDQLAGKL
ncbi:F0F1 ATP synthase subunit B [Gammaproteobacteria bacterium]|nr:F0F1 ATP synthase subunit B [Gammaproteobacteria bacterium]